MTPIDWIKRALGMVVTPSIDHLATYRAKVVAQSGHTVDVVADDARIGSLSGVIIMHGIPGAKSTFASGCFVRVGWRGGDPRYPYVSTWEPDASVTAIVVNGTTVYLGAESGAQFVALANKVIDELTAIQLAINTHQHPSGMGPTGTATVTYTAAGVAATKVKAV